MNMYKNLNCDLLGISGRQSEIIELALTYGFRGIDIDMEDMVKRCQRGTFESASRFLTSSKLKIGGFVAPIDLDSDDDSFTTRLAQLNGVAEIARRANANIALVSIPAATDRLPYPEYFDVIRTRVDQVAATLGKEEVRVALTFTPRCPEAEGKQFKFVRDCEGFSAIVRACTSKNVSIVFDSWNWFVGGGTEALLDQIGIERVAAVRLADCKEGVSAETATQEDCLLPGSTGVIDNVAWLTKFAEAKLKIPVTAVGKPIEAGGTRDTLVGLAQNALDKIFEAAGIPTQTRRPEMFAETSYASH
jgi:sugar phosphate isomerase/epimerase